MDIRILTDVVVLRTCAVEVTNVWVSPPELLPSNQDILPIYSRDYHHHVTTTSATSMDCKHQAPAIEQLHVNFSLQESI